MGKHRNFKSLMWGDTLLDNHIIFKPGSISEVHGVIFFKEKSKQKYKTDISQLLLPVKKS